ncbi:B12-binding domain-containing radical SAM protein [Chloroflexota bacterium]
METWICTTLASIFGPMQGAARLYAYLKKDGHNVYLKDLNQDAYFTLLSKKNLELTFERLRYMLESVTRSIFLREDMGSILLHSSNFAISQLLAKVVDHRIENGNVFYALLSAEGFIVSEVDKAREALDKQFFSLAPDEFLKHFRTLLCGKALIDAAYFPAQLDLGLGFHGTAYAPRFSDIISAVKDERHNYLIPYYHSEVMPLLSKEHPNVVGISITHTSEFIPALTFSHMIKSEHPEIHICLGGAVVTEVAYRIYKNPLLWNLFDSMILGPGEYAFSHLINNIEKGEDLSGVPNLIYKANGSIIKSDKLHEFDINDACTPEYTSVRPKSVLTLETASGCYWGKCIFCYYPMQGTVTNDPKYSKKRVRNIALVLEDIRKLRDSYDPIFIGITDASLQPKRIEQIVEYSLGSKRKVNFTAFFRFEKEFKSPAFCQKLTDGGFLGGQVGLESGSQRINNIINKGVDLKDAEVIVENLYKAGILTHLYTIIGIPGETMEDALMTFNFLKRFHHELTLGWQIYPLYVLEHGALNERASEFGLNTVPLPEEFLSQFMEYKVKSGLSQGESTITSIRFYEELKHFIHPLHEIMDTESQKVFLLAQKSKGIMPKEIESIYTNTKEITNYH